MSKKDCLDCPGCEFSIFSSFLNKETQDKFPESIKAYSTHDTHLFPKKSYVYREGDPIEGLYCLSSGLAKITRKIRGDGLAEEVTVGLASPGDLLGSFQPISGGVHQESLVAVEDITLCLIPMEKLRNLIKIEPKFSFNLIEKLNEKLNHRNFHLSVLSTSNVREKLAYTLLYLCKKFGTFDSKIHHLNLKLSREDYAHLAGTSVETVARTFSEFESEEVAHIKAKNIDILSIHGLEKISGISYSSIN